MKKYLKPVMSSTFEVSGYDDAQTKLVSLQDGDIIKYSGNKLGGVLSVIADNLDVGDEFTVGAEGSYIAPGPSDPGRTYRETTFVVTDQYRYGNGFAPMYAGRRPKLNSGASRSWRSISDGALWLTMKSDFEIVIHKQS